MLDANPHPELSFALDVADKAIKLAAVLLGGVWTYWNYRKSRTYEQKMELIIKGSTFSNVDLFCEIQVSLKNLGASKHLVEPAGSYCEVIAVFADLREEIVAFSPLFTRDNFIEPGESIGDLLLLRLPVEVDDAIWLRLRLRVVSQGRRISDSE